MLQQQRSNLDTERLTRGIPELKQWKIKDVIVSSASEQLWAWHDGEVDRVSTVYSCTKSFISALVGIALARGELDDLEQPIMDFFPLVGRSSDERKKRIKVKHLLTMTPGMDWPDFDKPYWAMKRTEDAVRYIVERPMAHEPGEAFTYNSGASYLLSAILTQATGMSVYDYADEHLFSKLGFRKPRWNRLHGIYEGGAGLHLAARDMAKFGRLYLQGGKWKGEQIIPQAWVEDSTSEHHKGLQHYEPRIFGSYGYHWWVSSKESNGIMDYYFAKGYGGQYIFVIPEKELVVAIRKEATNKSEALYSKRVLNEHILPAINVTL